MEQPTSFDVRPKFFQNTSLSDWSDWRWQQKHSASNLADLNKIYPGLAKNIQRHIESWHGKRLRFRITPYILSLLNKKPDMNLQRDAIARQFIPLFEDLLVEQSLRPDEYSKDKENWEEETEMITPICQWKYPNRVIIYSIDSCFVYCSYCLRSLQSDYQEERHGGRSLWDQTVDAIKAHPEIEEVIISGGDPVVYNNTRFDSMLSDIRNIDSVKALSFNSRVLSHNPFRVDDAFCSSLAKHHVTKFGIHINHPDEITDEFTSAIEKIQRAHGGVLLLAQTVLLKGVNDNAATLRELFMKLYCLGIKPYYLLHNMPNIPSAASQRTSVMTGVRLIKSIKRIISNPALPEYILVHRTGKKTIPLELSNTPGFIYTHNNDHHPIIKFENWKGEWVEYLDSANERVM